MKQYDEIFARIAGDEGKTKAEVYREMQKAIDAGFDNPDPKVRAAWRNIYQKGKRPTPEDVIAYCAMRLAPSRGVAQ